MSRVKGPRETSERVDLFRGGSVVSSLPGAFGASLRETRITALLGYVIAHKPEDFRGILNLKGDVRKIGIESDRDGDRADIEIRTTQGTCVVEAKCGATDPFRQARKYRADTRVLLTGLLTPERDGWADKIRYVSWQRMADHLASVGKKAGHPMKYLCGEIVRYLEEHRMIKVRDSVEVYAREINRERHLDLFLKAHIYVCEYAKNNRLSEALYFAPHFGKSLEKRNPGICHGICYVSKIEEVFIVDSWHSLRHSLSEERGKAWFASHRAIIRAVCGRKDWKRGVQLTFRPDRLTKRLTVSSGRLPRFL